MNDMELTTPKMSNRQCAYKTREKNQVTVKKPLSEKRCQKKELEQLLHHHGGNVKKLFNTSGLDYRNMKIKDSLPYLTEEKALGLLHANGNLIKRPVLIGKEVVLQGFKPDVWEKVFGLNK